MLYSSVRKSKSSNSNIQKLQVGNLTYSGDFVADGFYYALDELKNPDYSKNISHQDSSYLYLQLLEIAKLGPPIPPPSVADSEKILKGLKPDVSDLYSISPKHYLSAGPEGILHFNSLLNAFTTNIALTSLPVLNCARSVVIHKGHGWPKTSHRSYRCISSCPMLSKGLDEWVGSLRRSKWDSARAQTQYMAKGSSHEMA